MSIIAQQESLVKESLFQFISKNIPSAKLDVIDEIVLAYVISILEEASQDPCFDVEGFMEIMSAYVPGFEEVSPALVCQWLLELEAQLSRPEDTDSSPTSEESSGSDRISLTLQNLSEMLPTTNTPRSHTTSESSSLSSEPRRVVDCDEYSQQSAVLAEMFPNTAAMEIKHCISIANGDIEHAAATLLHRLEQGQAMSVLTLHGVKQPIICNDMELKNRIIERYSYVDKESSQKEHKPLAPKFEPKKLVRYRDNRIVSLKGERYTEVPKTGAEDENLKKPKKQHCP